MSPNTALVRNIRQSKRPSGVRGTGLRHKPRMIAAVSSRPHATDTALACAKSDTAIAAPTYWIIPAAIKRARAVRSDISELPLCAALPSPATAARLYLIVRIILLRCAVACVAHLLDVLTTRIGSLAFALATGSLLTLSGSSGTGGLKLAFTLFGFKGT